MLYGEFGIVFASEEIISCFFPLLSLPPFVHMEDLAHWLKYYTILSIFAYNNNHNNYKGSGGGGKKKEKRVIMTRFFLFLFNILQA